MEGPISEGIRPRPATCSARSIRKGHAGGGFVQHVVAERLVPALHHAKSTVLAGCGNHRPTTGQPDVHACHSVSTESPARGTERSNRRTSHYLQKRAATGGGYEP